MKRIKSLSLVLAIMLIFSLAMPVPVGAATVKINKSKITLAVGKTATLKITGTKQKPRWKSSNKKVATVGLTGGKVTAKKKGTATVTATIGKKKYACKVTVKPAKWVKITTNDFDLVRAGMLKGKIKYVENDDYLVSPDYYKKAIKPELDRMKASEKEYANPNGTNVLDPDVEFEIEDSKSKDKAKTNSKAETDKKIYNLKRTGFSSTETLDTELGKAYLEFCDTWVSQTELKNIYNISTEWDWPDNQLYLLMGVTDKYVIEGTPNTFVSGQIYTNGEVKYQYLEKFERNGKSFDNIKQYFFDREDLINKGIIK